MNEIQFLNMSLREIENFKNTIEQQKDEIINLKEEVTNLKDEVINLKDEINAIKDMLLSKEIKKENNNLCIIFCKYKKSILLKNQYQNDNSTVKCKEILKQMGAKWFKNDKQCGWLFIGAFKNEDESIENNSKFIIEKLQEEGYILSVKYEM